MKHFSFSQVKLSRIALALLALVTIAPVAASLHASVVQKSVNGGTTMKDTAIQDTSRVRQARRDFWRAVDVYRRLMQEGATNLASPEINDAASIEFYLNLENGGTLKGSAPESIPFISDAHVQYNALPEWDRDRIDGYVSTGFCPTRLRESSIEGYYELCVELMQERKDNARPQVDLSVVERQSIRTLNGSPIQTLRMRLRLLDESLNAPRTYEGTARPSLRQ